MFTKEALQFRTELADALTAEGYPDYGNALFGFRSIVLVDKPTDFKSVVRGGSLVLNKNLSMDEMCFMARHEILHIMYGHHFRRGDRHEKLWNIAADMEISNFYSVEDDELMLTRPNLDGGVNVNFPMFSIFLGKKAEEVYDILHDMMQQQQQEGDGMPQNSNSQGSSGQGGQSSGQGGGSQEGDGEGGGGGQSQGQDQNQDPIPDINQLLNDIENNEDLSQKVAKNLRNKLRKAMNNNPSEGEGEGEGQQKPPTTKVGTGSRKESDTNPYQGPPKQPQPSRKQPEEKDSQENGQPQAGQESNGEDMGDGLGFTGWDAEPLDVDDLSHNEAEDFDTGGNGVGTEHAERNVGKPLPAKVRLLRSLKGSFGKQRFYETKRTYSKPDRRFTTPGSLPRINGCEVMRKGRKRKNREWKTLGVYCDVSGSMSRDKISLALGTCQEIDKIRRCTVKTHYFDTEVRDEFFSGGGTDYNVVLEHAKQCGYKSIAIITDDSSDRIPRGVYSFDNLWIIGVEHSHRGDDKEHYSIGPQIVDGTVKVKHFDGFIVCTNED